MRHLIFLTPLWASEGYICENSQYKITICISSLTIAAAEEQKPLFVATDYVHILEKSSNKTFKYSPILYNISGGGDARFQSMDFSEFPPLKNSNINLDLYFFHDNNLHESVTGYFSKGFIGEDKTMDKHVITSGCQKYLFDNIQQPSDMCIFTNEEESEKTSH